MRKIADAQLHDTVDGNVRMDAVFYMQGAMDEFAKKSKQEIGQIGDASAAIFDAKMQLVAQGNDIPTMMGSAVISTKASVEAVGVKNLRPGDVIISNDVYLGGGNHQPDVQLTRPVFFEGEIIAIEKTGNIHITR